MFIQFTKKSRSLCKRLVLLSTLLLVVSVAYGNYWNADYDVTVQRSSTSTGSGTIYCASGNGSTTNVKPANAVLSSTKTSEKFNFYGDNFDNDKAGTLAGSLRAEPAFGSKFAGWVTDNVDKNPTGATYSDEISTQTLSNDKYAFTLAITKRRDDYSWSNNLSVHFIARSYCMNQPTVKIYLKDGENLTEHPAAGSVVINKEDAITQNGDLFIKQGNGTDANAVLALTYAATPNEGYYFVGWETSLENAKDDSYESTNPSYTRPFTSTCEYDADKTPAVQGTLPEETLYAIFERNQKYYYRTIEAELAGETNGAELVLSIQDGQNPNASATGTPVVTYSPNPPREMQDKRDFQVVYQVNITEPDKVSFVGWSSRPGAGIDLMPDDNNNPTTYTEEYQTHNTDINNPFDAPKVYAVLESYWFANAIVKQTDSSNKLGQVAFSMFEAEEPTNWAFEIDDSHTLHQVAVNDDEFKYSVFYYAKPLNGAKFVGWATANDPNAIIPGSDKIPYERQYSVTSKDKVNPYKSDVLYAIFQSNVDVMYQDDMICSVDVEGKPNVNDAKVIVDMGSVNALHAELLTNRSLFDLTDQYGMERGDVIDIVSNEGMARLLVTYTGNNPIADAEAYKTADIKLTTSDGGETTITIQMKPVPTITFLPTYGKGEYDINHTDGSGVHYTMESDDKDNIYISITQESLSIIELNLDFTETATTAFKGWQVNTKNGSTIISENLRTTYRFTEPATVRPVYTTKGAGVFTILGDEENVQYKDLKQALRVAKDRSDAKNQDQVVVFSNGGNQEAVLPQGDYVIPNRVTLLIPGVGPDDGFNPSSVETNFEEDTYIYREKHEAYIPNTEIMTDVVLGIEDYSSMSGEPVCYRKLKVADNTTITVEPGASINLYAYLTCNQTYNYDARPLRYGQIELGENCQIILQESANADVLAQLYAFGYITGPESSQVIANLGSEVFELLQYSELRGGTAIADLFLNRGINKVFPINQFYIQNIEVPLHIKYGAVENVIVTANMLAASEYVVMSGLIVPNQNKYQSGFIRMTEGMTITKSYEAYSDRLTLMASSQKTSSASLGFIDVRMGNLVPVLKPMLQDKLTSGDLAQYKDVIMPVAESMLEDYVGDVRLKSDDYVMPIPSNMDIVLNNVGLTIPFDVAWLAGSTLNVDEQSTLTIASGAKVYVYDFDEAILPEAEWTSGASRYAPGTGYFASTSATLIPISYTPNNSQHLLDANGAKIKSTDKTHIRNANGTYLFKRQMKALDAYEGELVTGDAQWTVDGKVVVNGELYTTAGNARIISNKQGKVTFANEPISGAVAKQAKLVGNQTALISGMMHSIAEDLGDIWLVGGIIEDLIKQKAGPKTDVHKIINFPVNSARLRNADGSFVATGKDTYTYSPIEGRWISSQDEPLGEIEGEVVTVTLPEVNKDIIIRLTEIEGLTSAEGITATVAWNGATPATSVQNITYADGVLQIPLQYVPTNKSGEYEGLLNVTANGNTISIRVVVIEDYTPVFNVSNPVQITSYVDHTTNTTPANFVLAPEVENVANTIRTAEDRYKATWTYTITGENADEFQLHWGAGDKKFTDAYISFTPNSAGDKTALLSFNVTYVDANKKKHVTNIAVPLVGTALGITANPLRFADGIESMFIDASATNLFANVANGNTNPIVIQPATSEYYTIVGTGMSMTIQPKKIGTVTITAEQDEDLVHGVAAISITKTITITDNVVWNWEQLYFGSENKYPISTLYNEWRLEIKDNHLNVIREFNSVNPGDYQVILESWPDGEAMPVFTFIYDDGTGEKSRDFTSRVTRDPRHLSVYVNEDFVYEAITLNANNVSKAASSSDYYVRFTSAENQIAQWTLYFTGIPDKLSFNATGDNNWQIEESANGINWTVAYTWAKISSDSEFELSLQPSTNYLRISYSAEKASIGALSKIAITELISVKADIDKLYMPILSPSSQKDVVFTYVSEAQLQLKTNNAVFTTNPTELAGTTPAVPYRMERVTVDSKATTEIRDGLLSVVGSAAAVPIRTFEYPQALPIQLASDELERYYFVVSESYKTSWSNDETTRAIVMRNAVADAAPYAVFHFADAPAPGVISFNYSSNSNAASWTIQESADGTVWYDLEKNDNESAGLVMRNFMRPETSRYVRVIYNSDYAGMVELTNFAILPTTSVVVDPAQLTIFSDQNEELSIIASNLQDVTFTLSPGFEIAKVTDENGTTKTLDYFKGNGAHKGTLEIAYTSTNAITYGTLVITTSKAADGTSLATPEVLATVELTGINRKLPNGETGIYTGVGEGYTISGTWDGKTRRPVNSEHAFANGTPLFDYVIIYGETKTTDGSKTISLPSSVNGSNAQTPCYIYKKSGNNYILENESYFVENANNSRKSLRGAISIADADGIDANPDQLRVYITGFCPYASTGYTQSDDGVWYFEGDAGDKIDIYLEDCYIYSRYKSKRGNSFTRESGESYSGMVAKGSGAVLLFACKTQTDGLSTPLEVTIHTRESNLLKSHYGCLFSSFVGRAFQISSPVHIYMQSEDHYNNSYTTLTFDDKWPTTSATDANGVFTTIERTNGFLSLQKQVNNAPSIDMGNKKTVVNFRGGHVELQNACISSDNYESSLAISYRTGVYGPSKFRFVLSKGIGTDGVEGTVNFYDGTTSVLPMTVPERFRQYYLMDTDANGNELTTTSCLRTPKNTYVYGGSHCMMRACSEPTSKGGAPTDGATGKPLGKFEYTQGWNENGSYGLVTPTTFPDDCLTGYYESAAGYENQTYGLQSVTPVDGKLNFWIPKLDCPESEFEVKPEVDQKISFWKASMTKIAANYGVYDGEVGGDFSVEMNAEGNQVEQVQNLLYCQIDEKIIGVIRKNTGDDKYVAPVLNPAPDGGYISIAPTSVGEDVQHYIGNEEPYRVEDKVYYVTTIPQADVWINFTAPFNVEKIYVVETYDEDFLSTLGTRDIVMEEQAKHNADFAAFFGVAIALESKKTFNLIYQDYLGWVREQDGSTDKRGMLELEHYYETKDAEGKFNSNWKTADYYLYKNTGNWTLNASGKLDTKWNFVTTKEGTKQNILLKQGETYSMLFPYCTGCWDYDELSDIYSRDDWDYWSGKFLIFESTDGPHIIQGSNYINAADDPDGNKQGDWAFEVAPTDNEVKLMGNNTFAKFSTNNSNISSYAASPMQENYTPIGKNEEEILPTASFLYGDMSKDGIRPRILRDGSLRYDNQNTTTGGKVPTVGGGNDMFITAIEGGINIAVAAPQVVRVLSSTGSVIFAGTITTATDVLLPTSGIYIISGENEVQKILY